MSLSLLFSDLKEADPEVYEIVIKEENRQRLTLNLIASENYAPRSVLQATASLMTNKYAEGYPGKRYYGGCQYVDEVENLARERAKLLFGAEHANVQPHSGTQANMSVYFAVLKPGDTILAMELSQGGHLSHGSPVSFSGKLYNVVYYTVSRETEMIDYDLVRELALKHKPKLIIAGASSYPRAIDSKAFREIADEVGAYFMFDMAHYAGLIAAGLYPSPVKWADFVTSTTHKTLRGPRGGFILTKKKWAKKVDKAVFPGAQGGPLMHVIAAKAVAFKLAMEEEFKEYQRQVIKNAKALAESLAEKGFRIVSGGTDSHMVLVDVRSANLTGAQAEALLEEVGIVVNKNLIPYDPNPPRVTSGIRLGTPALTTRGMKEDEIREVASLIAERLLNPESDSVKERVRSRVRELAEAFPIPKGFEP